MASTKGSAKKRLKQPSSLHVSRRDFLVATAALASTNLTVESHRLQPEAPGASAEARADASNELALEGGAAVRATMLEAKLSGPQYYDDDERQELLDVLDNRSPFRWWGLDAKGHPPDKCINFEKEFAARQQTRYSVAITSGTTALITAMAALGVGPGDEVILPAWTWYACYDAVLLAGALPVFAEIDESMDIDPTDIERHITPRTKVIMAVHILGEPADMDPILAVARQHNLKVLEDCAQSVGATYKGKPVGSMGDCGIFSFQVNKTISAGEGGALVTSDPYIFERAARFHDVGTLREGHAKTLGQPPRLQRFAGGQYRMSEFTGAVMRAQLRKLDRIVADFRDKRDRVIAGLRELPGIQFRKQNDPTGGIGNWIFIRSAGKTQRDHFIQAMGAENVSAHAMGGSVILPLEPHIEAKQTLQPDWPSFSTPQGRAMRYGRACCARSIEVYERHVGIAIDPKFSGQDLADITAATRKVYLGLVRT